MVKKRVITGISILMTVSAIIYMVNILEYFGIRFSLVSYCSFILGLILTLVFLIYPARQKASNEKTPWYDFVFIAGSLFSTMYVVMFPERREDALSMGIVTDTTTIIACFTLIIAILEASRRTLGWSMLIPTVLFVIHLFVGTHLPGVLRTFPFSIERITTLFYYTPDGVFSTPVVVACTIILVFMLFAAILENTGAGKFFTNIAFALTGRFSGGTAKASLIASGLMGTMTGATVVDIVTTGSLTIPMMKKEGFTPNVSAAIGCCAGNGAQLVPPVMGICAFLIAEILGVPYVSVCLAAIVPALLYYLALIAQIHLYAKKKGLHGFPAEELPSFKEVLKEGWLYIIPIVILIYVLVGLGLPVQHCGLIASITGIVIAIIDFQRKKETRKKLKEWLIWFVRLTEGAAKMLLIPAVACAASGLIIGSVDTSGLGFRLSSYILKASGESLFVLALLTAAASYILGFPLSTVPCYLILAILVAPAMVKVGVVPMAAHLFVFYWGIASFITPPVAVGAFVAAGIAQADPNKTGWIAMRLAFVTYAVSFLFVYNQGLLLMGSFEKIVLALIFSIIFTLCYAVGFEGFIGRRLNWLQRVLFFASGTVCGVAVAASSWGIGAVGFLITLIGVFWYKKGAEPETKLQEVKQ